MKPKILFVDDEPNILDSLKLSLRPLRIKWDMIFAVSGQDALNILAKTHVDMVVTDMRMPGMDGAQLLALVREFYPNAIRLILSGYSDEESVFKTVKLAHQYLSKPCRPVDLIQTIGQALRLHDVLADTHIKSVIAGLDSLPVLHPIYTQLVDVLQNDTNTASQIGNIICQDVAICALILKLVNSAFFGLPVRVTSLHHAVKLLGSQTLRVLVLSTSLFTTFKPTEIPNFSIKMLWEHCFRVGCFAKTIGENLGLKHEDLDDCFIAGILHDIGKLILATKMRQEFASVLDKVRAENRPVYVVERELMGITHAEVGAYLMALWGFSNSAMDAICWHHELERLSCECISPLLAVMIANRLDHELVVIHQGYAPHLIETDCTLNTSLQERVAEWRELFSNQLKDGSNNVI